MYQLASPKASDLREREIAKRKQKFVTVKIILWLYILVIGKGNSKSWNLCFVHVSDFR